MSSSAEETEPRWLSEEEQACWRAYLHGTRLLEVALDADLSAHGTSLPEYEILSMLSEAPGRRMRMSALADLVVQSRSRMTHTAGRLEGRGLVRREPSPHDGRGVELTLTDKGLETLERLSKVHVESVRRHFVDLLTPTQFRKLGEAMAIVQESGRARR
ncbi:MAG: MarR family transcriptional regulator [Actinomycetales bacterium]|nr:MarR family transcriptional regulator [Actinomycetales bacterium]